MQPMPMLSVAVDAMGGDHGARVIVPATARALAQHPQLQVLLVGQRDKLDSLLASAGLLHHPRCSVLAASEVVAMDEAPALALRHKKDSSMRRALDAVASGQAQAMVSAGNTGALMASAHFVLKMLPGLERPAIAAILPTYDSQVCVLDLGANVECQPRHLLDFAHMGVALVRCLGWGDNPRVGMLNIGTEPIKGHEQIRQAYQLLSQSQLNFVGNVEGDQVFNSAAEVVVCDGFVGNVALKTTEGVARLIARVLREEFGRSWYSRLLGLCAWPVIQRFKRRVDPPGYNGAMLLGLRALVVKSHGNAEVEAFTAAISRAYQLASSDILSQLERHFQERP